jgi:hypothetical protein
MKRRVEQAPADGAAVAPRSRDRAAEVALPEARA